MFSFKPKPRKHGGLFGYFAPPSGGKTFILTDVAVKLMRSGETRVFSNFPIITPDGKYVSKYIDKSMLGCSDLNLDGSYIFYQELWRDFNTNDYQALDQDLHHYNDFFSTLGHHEISFHADSQELRKLWIRVREDINEFISIEKVCYPMTTKPIFFNLFTYRTEEDMRNSLYRPGAIFKTERVWFNLYSASSYDTRFFRNDSVPPFEGKDWITVLNERGLQPDLPEYSLLGGYIRQIKHKISVCALILTVTFAELWYHLMVSAVMKRVPWKIMIAVVITRVILNRISLILVRALTRIWKRIADYLRIYTVRVQVYEWNRFPRLKFLKQKLFK